MSRRRASRDNPVTATRPVGLRDYAQTAPARAPSTPSRCTLCRAWFVDDDPDGREAHRVVFGHPPTVVVREGAGPGNEGATDDMVQGR